METKECKVCYNRIFIKAKKCQYCLEWQDKIDDSKQEIIEEDIQLFENRFENVRIANPFQRRLISGFRLPYLVLIFIIVTLMFVAIQTSWYLLDEDRIYLFSFLAFGIQMIFSWGGIIWIYELLKDNVDSFVKISTDSEFDVNKRFIVAFNKMFSAKTAILSGIIVGFLASIGDYFVGTPFKTHEAKIIFAVFEFINMFFAGAALSTMIMFAYYLQDLKVASSHKTLNLEKSLAIKRLGSIHLKTSLLAIVPLILGVLAKIIGNWSWDLLIMLWYIGFSILILIYIFWPMQNIHELMVEDIEAQAKKIGHKIEILLFELNSNPSSRNFRKLNELREWENSLSEQNTWPFDYKAIWAVFLAIIFPILMMALDRIWGS